jgi:hypothetical protein
MAHYSQRKRSTTEPFMDVDITNRTTQQQEIKV